MSYNPIDQIKKTIEQHESEAKWERETAKAHLGQAVSAHARAAEHEVAAAEWRKILAREESSTRTVTVKLDADVSGFMEGKGSALGV